MNSRPFSKVMAGFSVAAALCSACGGGASTEVEAALRRGEVDLALRLYDAQGGADPGSLRGIAEVVLEREARSGDPRRSAAAFAALRGAGTAARPLLERLSDTADTGGSRVTELRALALLAQLGDVGARQTLREWAASSDPETQVAVAPALDPANADDAERLRSLLDSPSAQARGAAVAQLAHAPADGDTLAALARAARLDPELTVRSGALRALAAQGPAGVQVIAERVDDSDPEVRAAAAAALAFADPAFARERLAALLAAEPTPAGIEAARALLAVDPRAAPPSARDQLARALSHADATLRGRAAVALMSLRDPVLAPLAAARLAKEPARSVRLCLVLALAPGDPSRKPLLQSLLPGEDAVSAQIAAELARGGDARALATLRGLVHAKEARVRGVAVRSLGRELGRPHDVRAALRDADAGVRIAAAATILSAPARA